MTICSMLVYTCYDWWWAVRTGQTTLHVMLDFGCWRPYESFMSMIWLIELLITILCIGHEVWNHVCVLMLLLMPTWWVFLILIMLDLYNYHHGWHACIVMWHKQTMCWMSMLLMQYNAMWWWLSMMVRSLMILVWSRYFDTPWCNLVC